MKFVNIKLTEEDINECLKDSLEKNEPTKKRKNKLIKKTRPAIM